jgi:arsenate reductase
MALKFYQYPKCSTCVKAGKFLKDKKVAVETIDITVTPPSVAELKSMLQFYDNDLRKLFNTSGVVYKEMNMKDKINKITEAEAIKLLSKNGKLVKRPFLIGTQIGLVGFNEDAWETVK